MSAVCPAAMRRMVVSSTDAITCKFFKSAMLKITGDWNSRYRPRAHWCPTRSPIEIGCELCPLERGFGIIHRQLLFIHIRLRGGKFRRVCALVQIGAVGLRLLQRYVCRLNCQLRVCYVERLPPALAFANAVCASASSAVLCVMFAAPAQILLLLNLIGIERVARIHQCVIGNVYALLIFCPSRFRNGGF